MRRGRRVSSKHLVVHYIARPESAVPRAGFVVGKVVGNSVIRHRVTRQLRHVVAEHLRALPPTLDLVVRGLPGAADAEIRTELDALLHQVRARV